jgi:hypothetical protein
MIFRRMTLIAAAIVAMTVVVPVSASAASAYCGITWGSAEKNAPWTAATELVNIRAGRHDCYDRLVFDFRGTTQGHHVTYVDEVTEDGSGRPVPLRGAGKLQITVGGPAYDQDGNLTYTFANRAELLNVTGYQTFRQVAWAGSFEGTTTVGLGVRARLPFRVLTLPNRIIVDVAHFW